MAIKWSASKVSEALDEVEKQISLAESFFEEAKKKAKEAQRIPNLPQYMAQSLNRVFYQIERIDNVKSALQSARDAIPKGEIEKWRKRDSMGSTGSLFNPSVN